jgi:hypothetical protein
MALIDKLQVKKGVEANLPVLDVGEPAFTTDTEKPYIGAGSGNIQLAKYQDIINHENAYGKHMLKEKFVRSGKDVNNIFSTIEHFRADDTLYYKSVLSGGASPLYTTRTETFYDTDGITELLVNVYTIAYDGDGDIISETPN